MSNVNLLVDAKNILYRSIFAAKRNHPLAVFFEFINNCAYSSNATSIHVFWDCPRSEVWRKDVLDTYKDNRNQKTDEDVAAKISATTAVLKSCLPHLGIRQYYMPKCEADDLIYAFVSVKHPEETVILSTDSDLIQIPYRFGSCRQINQKGEFVSIPNINPVTLKALVGDTSDNIPGYYGIGPVKGSKIAENQARLLEFLDKTGRDTFYRNLKLIDLGMSNVLMESKMMALEGSMVNIDHDVVKAQNTLKEHSMPIDLYSMNIPKLLGLVPKI